MTATGTTAGALPPALPTDFSGGTTGAATTGAATTTAATSTTPPTAGTTTSFESATATGGGFKAIPAPGCSTPAPIQQLPGQAAGGGMVAGAAGAPIKGGGGGDLAGALGSLTAVIQQLQSAVGGVAGGGPAQKAAAPVQQGAVAGANGSPAQKTDVAGSGGPAQKSDVAGDKGGPVQKTDVAGSGGPEQKPCDMKHASGGGASASTVAGANGTPAANAAEGATQVQGGGGAANNEALVAALKGLVEVLNQLVTALAGVNGGGPAGKPGQVPPSDVKGDNGAPVQQSPIQTPIQTAPPKTDVDGEQGPGQKPPVTQLPPPTTPPITPGTPPPSLPTVTPPPVVPAPPSQVDGANGGPGQKPTQVPSQVDGANGGPGQKPTQVPSQVDGANGGPGQKPTQVPSQVDGAQGAPQQEPTQVPITPKAPTQVDGANGGPGKPEQVPTQTPTQAPPKTEVAGARQGNVKLDNDDDRWSAKLTAGGGKAEHSVELWGDPHVVITVDGKAEKFDIGFGKGDVTLFDGTKVTWDTYAKGDKLAGQRPGANDDVSYILRDFKVDSAGSEFDRAVTTRDRNGDKGDQMGLTTALTDSHLKELAIALRTMEGPMSDALKNGTWVSPAFQNPAQGPGQAPGQTTQQTA